jgi:hypothetical protein
LPRMFASWNNRFDDTVYAMGIEVDDLMSIIKYDILTISWILLFFDNMKTNLAEKLSF